jgi:uncharacterized repeat protein (TIGR03803 family)
VARSLHWEFKGQFTKKIDEGDTVMKTIQHSISKMLRRTESTALTLVVVLGLIVITNRSVQAQTYKESVLYSFTGGADGAKPQAGLIMDAKGNVYGTTVYGGASGDGVVFKVNKSGHESLLHTFKGGKDGEYPFAGLIFDAEGNLYGTTAQGGTSNAGTVFELSSKGKETILYSFTGGADGANPRAGLIFDAKGNLYSTTYGGGAYGAGTVFKLSSKGKESVLYSFSGAADGGNPQAGLIFDAKGNLYGTTVVGGTEFDAGTVFKVTSKGTETVLYSFCPTGACVDGANPVASLIFNAKGNELYGTTPNGGFYGFGNVFKVNEKGEEIVLCAFNGGAPGAAPLAGLIFDAKGNLYGTAAAGMPSYAGNVFKVNEKGDETVLYQFTGGADGSNPAAGLIFDAKGSLYGTTEAGGASGQGTVFKVSR